jgi:CRP-like cAMP-binding protein
MNVIAIRDLLAAQRVLHDLQDSDFDLMAGCGHIEVFPAGRFLIRENTDANHFFVIREGRVGLELAAPTGPLMVETLGPGELVGWSWLFPPYRWTFDVEALEQTHAIVIDAACLRAKCDDDAEFGYRVMRAFSKVMVGRLQSTRLRLLDLYGGVHAG